MISFTSIFPNNSTCQIQTLTKDNISFDHFHSLINLLLQLTITHQPTHTLHITHQHVQPHNSLHNHPLWCSRIIYRICKVKSNRPLIYSITKMEVGNVEYQLLLTTSINIRL